MSEVSAVALCVDNQRLKAGILVHFSIRSVNKVSVKCQPSKGCSYLPQSMRQLPFLSLRNFNVVLSTESSL